MHRNYKRWNKILLASAYLKGGGTPFPSESGECSIYLIAPSSSFHPRKIQHAVSPEYSHQALGVYNGILCHG